MTDDIKETEHEGPNATEDDHYLLSQVGLASMLGVSVTTVQRMRKDPGFPRRRFFGGGTRAWIKGEVKAWMEKRPAA